MSELQDKGQAIDEEKLAKIKFKFCIIPHLYTQILKLLVDNTSPDSQSCYVNKQTGNFLWKDVPLPSVAKAIHHFKHMGLTYTDSSNQGSSTIEYRLKINGDYKQFFGKIVQIIQVPLYEPLNRTQKTHKMNTFFCVQRFEKLSTCDEKKNTYPRLLPDLNIHVFYSPPLLSEDQKNCFCDFDNY